MCPVDLNNAGAVRRGPNLATQVYNAISELIVSGRLRPGERIVLDRLARELGVSQTPVREALAGLRQEGLIVGDVPPGKLHVVPLTRDYVHSTYLVRSVLEGLAAELATPRLSVEELETIASLIEEIGSVIHSPDHQLRFHHDQTLHRLLWEAAGNQVLLRELGALENHINYIRSYSLRHSGEHVSKGHTEHLVILDALRVGDAQGTRIAMEVHIRNTSKRIIDLIEFERTR